jgi:hypothetical protein
MPTPYELGVTIAAHNRRGRLRRYSEALQGHSGKGVDAPAILAAVSVQPSANLLAGATPA